ncbi:hypothetical protein [Allorhodopirellula heiligendammensis]|uniref:hypothetical protein n=1 Tax=Allorhodopirellula heiligendammensis TaxID=2714739 RepID=UPI0011B4F31D|nr:hypothetical protein [Allorhodopirellula heiligendammensis]
MKTYWFGCPGQRVVELEVSFAAPAPSASATSPPAGNGTPPNAPRAFSVNIERHIFRCFKCHRSGNALDLWGIHRQLSIYAAAREIQDRPIKTSNRKTAPGRPPIKQPRHRPPPLNWLNS